MVGANITHVDIKVVTNDATITFYYHRMDSAHDGNEKLSLIETLIK